MANAKAAPFRLAILRANAKVLKVLGNMARPTYLLRSQRSGEVTMLERKRA